MFVEFSVTILFIRKTSQNSRHQKRTALRTQIAGGTKGTIISFQSLTFFPDEDNQIIKIQEFLPIAVDSSLNG